MIKALSILIKETLIKAVNSIFGSIRFLQPLAKEARGVLPHFSHT